MPCMPVSASVAWGCAGCLECCVLMKVHLLTQSHSCSGLRCQAKPAVTAGATWPQAPENKHSVYNVTPRAGGKPSASSDSLSNVATSTSSWCGIRQLEVLKQAALVLKLHKRVQLELSNFPELVPPLRDIEMPLVSA